MKQDRLDGIRVAGAITSSANSHDTAEDPGVEPEEFEAGNALLVDEFGATVSLQSASQLQRISKNFWLSTALNSAADGIVILDPEGLVQYLNPVAQRLTGCLPEQAVGKHFRMVLVFEYRGAIVKDDLLRLATLNEEPLSLGQDLILVARDGKRCQVEAEISTGTKASGAFGSAVVTLRDVTQRKWEEHQYRQEHAIRAVERLAETTAHRLNNLLTTILGNGELLLNSPGLAGDQRENLMPIMDAAEEAATVVRQLSAISRTKFATRKDLDINALIEKFLPVLSTSVPRRIRISTNLDRGIRDVSADADQLEQILFSLIQNAVDSIPSRGHIRITTQNTFIDATERDSSPRQFVSVKIQDTGDGMSEKTKECIFEPFFTLKKDSAHPGLGLSIAQGIIRDYKGFIEVKSELGEGTEITFGLPCVEADPYAYLDQTTAEPRNFGTPTILLVEDDNAVRRLVRRILEKNHYQVIEAPDGESALSVALLHEGRIDLMVTDIGMPGISGPDLVRQFVRLHPESKFLLISGFSSHKLSEDPALPPGTEFLKKPFSHKDLVAHIRQLLPDQTASTPASTPASIQGNH